MRKTTIAALTLLICSGCSRETKTTAQDVGKETTEAARTAADFAREQAALAKREAQQKIDELDQRIDELERRGKKSSGQLKSRMQETAKDMRAESKRLKDRMSTWDDKAVEAWQTTRQEVGEAVSKAEGAIDRVLERVRN